jgi:hypothetical protein
VNNTLCDVSVKDSEIWDFFLVWFDLIEGRDVVDDAIDPGSLYVSDMR